MILTDEISTNIIKTNFIFCITRVIASDCVVYIIKKHVF